MNEMAEVRDDITVESPTRGEKGDHDGRRVDAHDAIWPNLKRELAFGYRADGLNPCSLAENTRDEQAIPCAPRVEGASVDNEAVRRHLDHGEAAVPDHRVLVIEKHRPRGQGVPDRVDGQGGDPSEPVEGHGMPFAQQTVEDNSDLLANRVEPRNRSANLLSQFGDFR